MAKQEDYESYYANHLHRLYNSEEQIAEFVDKLSEEAQHTELKQVLEKEKSLIDQERQTVKRLSERFEGQAEARRLESIQQMISEAEDVLEEDKGKDATLRDLGIISMLQQLKAQEKSILRALLTHAEEMQLKDDVRCFQSILQRENKSDQKLTNIVRNNLYPQAKESMQQRS